MSWVTNVILNLALEAQEQIDEVNEFFIEKEEEPLASIEPVWFGKGHSYETGLFVGAYNYFPLDQFVAHLAGMNWEDKDLVQLFVLDQEETRFREVTIFEAV